MGKLKHGHCKRGKRTRTYRVWNNMIIRCKYPYVENFKRYGGKGIKVCRRWQSFACFLADMGEVPEGKTLERISSKGNYEPTNCRWATPLEQGANLANNILVKFRGRTQHVAAWAREFGLAYSALYYRLFEAQWPIEQAMTIPSWKTLRQR